MLSSFLDAFDEVRARPQLKKDTLAVYKDIHARYMMEKRRMSLGLLPFQDVDFAWYVSKTGLMDSWRLHRCLFLPLLELLRVADLAKQVSACRLKKE